jgi:membrane protein YdbS with pleckstrin-like domain
VIEEPTEPAGVEPVPDAPVPAPMPAQPAAPPSDLGIQADGAERRLSPAFVPFQRAVAWVFTAVVSFFTLIAALTGWLSGELPRWAMQLLVPAWLAVTIAVAWFGQIWPVYEYRRTSYVLDHEGIEIRSGVFWRVITNVPRSRVQHIDVSQGPIERSYGLGRLVIFTAGTHHSRVELPGLDHAVAFALRNHLLPRGSDDAI